MNKRLKGEEAGDPYDPKAIPGWEDQDAIAERALARVHTVFQRCGMAPTEDPATVTPADKAKHSWCHVPNYRDESYANLEKIMAKLEQAELREDNDGANGNHPEWTVGQGGAVVPRDPVAFTVAGAGEVAVNGVYEQEASNPFAFRRKDDKANGDLAESEVHTLHRADGKWVIGHGCQLRKMQCHAAVIEGETLPPADGWVCKRGSKTPAPTITLPGPPDEMDSEEQPPEDDASGDDDAGGEAADGAAGSAARHRGVPEADMVLMNDPHKHTGGHLPMKAARQLKKAALLAEWDEFAEKTGSHLESFGIADVKGWDGGTDRAFAGPCGIGHVPSAGNCALEAFAVGWHTWLIVSRRIGIAVYRDSIDVGDGPVDADCHFDPRVDPYGPDHPGMSFLHAVAHIRRKMVALVKTAA